MNIAQQQPSGASLSDILTAIKNLVTALNTVATDYLNVQGQSSRCNITVPTVLKTTAGRVCQVVVVGAGTAAGYIYDGNTVASTTNVIWEIPTTVGDEPYIVNMPTSTGINVVPGAGQSVTVSYS
jgi:hypothetical protein